MNNTCVIIPAYNEERAIGAVIRGVRSQGLDTCVIDDGSLDDTGNIAESEGAAVIKHQKNMGKGMSLRDGFVYALKKGYDVVITMDGDGQHRVEDIGNFMKRYAEGSAGMIIGNRMDNAKGMPLIRIITNKFMSWLLSSMAGQRIPDTQCGFRLISAPCLKSIRLDSERFDIESELIIKASRAGCNIVSVPVESVYADEVSKVNPVTDTLRFIRFVYRIRKNG